MSDKEQREQEIESEVPNVRIRAGNGEAVRPDGDYVLYWMIAFRRSRYNFSLQRAVDWAQEFRKPLIIFEALRCGYRWASDRLHYFVIQGMADNQKFLDSKSALYYPYLERTKGDGRGLLAGLAEKACVVVSDDFPSFFLPRMIDAAAKQIPARFELVDSNGLLPMRAADKVFARAYDFRRFLQKNLRPHLGEFPKEDPLYRLQLPKLDGLPKKIEKKWPPADVQKIAADASLLEDFPIDHDVNVSPIEGGMGAADRVLSEFISKKLADYADDRNDPDEDGTSGFSPYLHFGHLSPHEVFERIAKKEKWSPSSLSDKTSGSREGWWGMSEAAEAFLDELITWREVGYNMCWQREDYDQYESLPDWAKETLAEHESDQREHVYSLQEFENAETHDEIWNASQRQLVREGRIHNYLRMLWGKKILHWTGSPQDALDIMIELNNKYGVDGRNPNSYSGIFWVLGRYDRAWGPEREIFGKIRYMTSDSTAKKVRLKEYLVKYGEQESSNSE